MRSREYMFVLITSICLIFALVSFQNKCLVSGQVSSTESEIGTILDATEPSIIVDHSPSKRLLDEYRIVLQENYSMSAQLRDFAEVMDDIGARAQKVYERTH